MKHGAICSLMWLMSGAALGAGASGRIPEEEREGFEYIRENDLRADLTFLASDATQGRMSLQPGDEVAAQWVAAEFAKAGLEPAGHDSGDGPRSFRTCR